MKKKDNKIVLFNNKQVRRYFDESKEHWYFFVIDATPKRCWVDLKNKLKNEGSKMYDKIVQLKMKSQDEKMRKFGLLRLKS